jgi:hypothetical protein
MGDDEAAALSAIQRQITNASSRDVVNKINFSQFRNFETNLTATHIDACHSQKKPYTAATKEAKTALEEAREALLNAVDAVRIEMKAQEPHPLVTGDGDGGDDDGGGNSLYLPGDGGDGGDGGSHVVLYVIIGVVGLLLLGGFLVAFGGRLPQLLFSTDEQVDLQENIEHAPLLSKDADEMRDTGYQQVASEENDDFSGVPAYDPHVPRESVSRDIQWEDIPNVERMTGNLL